jgi:hypothetical protein
MPGKPDKPFSVFGPSTAVELAKFANARGVVASLLGEPTAPPIPAEPKEPVTEAGRPELAGDIATAADIGDGKLTDRETAESARQPDIKSDKQKKNRRRLSDHGQAVAEILRRANKRGDGLTKAAAIRDYCKEHPTASPSSIDRELSDNSERWKV